MLGTGALCLCVPSGLSLALQNVWPCEVLHLFRLLFSLCEGEEMDDFWLQFKKKKYETHTASLLVNLHHKTATVFPGILNSSFSKPLNPVHGKTGRLVSVHVGERGTQLQGGPVPGAGRGGCCLAWLGVPGARGSPRAGHLPDRHTAGPQLGLSLSPPESCSSRAGVSPCGSVCIPPSFCLKQRV